MDFDKANLDMNTLEQFKVILEDWIPQDASIAIAINNTFVFFQFGRS